MKKIGMIAAMTNELNAMLKKFDAVETVRDPLGKKIVLAKKGDKEIYIAESGVGEILAASATQHLISAYGVEAIVNFGVCGSLKNRHGLKKTVLVGGVVHYEIDTSALDDAEVGRYPFLPGVVIPTDSFLLEKAAELNPSLEKVLCASGNRFIADPKEKAYLVDAFDADVCEMEAAGIALTCHAANVPCLMIKAVSDGEGGAEDFRATVNEAAEVYTDLVIDLLNLL